MENIIHKKKKKYFSFAKINKYCIFPFISPIFIFIRDILFEYSKEKTRGVRKILQYEFYDGLMHIACILLYIIYYFKTRTRTKTKRKEEILFMKKTYGNNKKSDNNKFKIFFLILTIGIGFHNYISNQMLLKEKTIFEIRVYHVFYNTILCKIILGYPIYRHHLLSLILIIIGWILISIPIFIKLTTDDIYYNILFFFEAIFYPLYLALLKYIIENYFISVYLCKFFIGIISLIISIILTIINSAMIYSNMYDLINIFDFSYDKLLFFFAFVSGIIVQFIFGVIIDIFSPNIFVLTNVISSIIKWIHNVCFKSNFDTTSNLICLSIGYFIILISCLIYNEIIILHFCNINQDTNVDINRRIEIENNMMEYYDKNELTDIGGYYIRRDQFYDNLSINNTDQKSYDRSSNDY